MLMPILVVNLLILVAALLLLTCLARPVASEAPAASFAHVLAGAAPGIEPAPLPTAVPLAPAQALLTGSPPGAIPQPSPASGGHDARENTPLSLADRLAVIRYMLQGRRVEETAALVRVPADAVRALYLQHGRREAATC